MFKTLFLFLAIGALSLLGYHEYKKNTNSLDADGHSIASRYTGQAKDKLLEGVDRLKGRLNLGDSSEGETTNAEGAASELAESAAESAEGVQEDAQNAVSSATEKASETADAMTAEASDAVESMKDQASEAVDGVTSNVSDAADAIKDQAGDLADAATDLAADAGDTAASAADSATDAVQDVADQAEGIADDLKAQAGEAAETLTDQASDVIENTTAVAEEAENAVSTSAEDSAQESDESTTNTTESAASTSSDAEAGASDESESLSLSGLSRVLGNALGSTKSVLAGVTDEASAKEALPRLEEANASVQKVAKLIPNIPDVAKGPLSKLVGNGLSGIKPLADSALSLPGVGDTLQPVVGPMLETLSTLSE